MERLFYFDCNATTRILPEALEAMLPFYRDLYANPNSLHAFGHQLERHLEKAREQVAKSVGAKRVSELVFTGSGTEANNTAILSALAQDKKKQHIITTKVEHSSILKLCAYLETKGVRVSYLSVDAQGHLDLAELESLISEDTALVSIMWANNETGVVFPIEKFSQLCERKQVPLHVDAIQVLGKLEISLSNLAVNYLSVSAHKFQGPKGVGALYVKRGTPFTPLLFGGGQEMGKRSGTQAVPLIVGMGVAASHAESKRAQEGIRIKQLRDFFESEILNAFPSARINGDKRQRLCNTSSIGFPGIEAESFLLALSEKGICASSGSACTSGKLNPSHVLRAMGVSKEYAAGSIRFSFGHETQEAEVKEALGIIFGLLERFSVKSSF